MAGTYESLERIVWMVIFSVLTFFLTMVIVIYQETFGNDRESVPFWMGLAIINAIAIQGLTS